MKSGEGVKVPKPVYESLAEDRIETKIRFDTRTSETHTLIEVEAEDRVGLLYFVSQALHEEGLNIAVAKITTEMGAAIDTFYVRDEHGLKVDSEPRLHSIAATLQTRIETFLNT